jgi:hypothetical protein
MIKDFNFWFSAITGTTAIIALILTFIQIRLSNKQSLFERRLECYLKIDGLMQLYKENQKSLEAERKDEPLFAVDLEFLWLTNNTYLEEASEAIKKPLENPGHKKFLIKREELKKLSTEVELIFKGRSAKTISCFISDYEQLLFKMYQYQILLNNMRNYSEQLKATLEMAQKEVNETAYREKLLNAYADIKMVYLQVSQNYVMEKLKSQLKL